jgi:hypothetical protein
MKDESEPVSDDEWLLRRVRVERFKRADRPLSPNVSRISSRIFSPSSRPTPRKDFPDERFALSKLALNATGRANWRAT